MTEVIQRKDQLQNKDVAVKKHTKAIDSLMWALRAKLYTAADSTALQAARVYLEETDGVGPIIFAAATHRGHPDSAIVAGLLEELFRDYPDVLNFMHLVAATETWNNFFMSTLASFFYEHLVFVDRRPKASGISMRKLVIELKKKKHSLMMFSHGTRDIGASIKISLLELANFAGAPIAVINMYGNEPLLPKVDGRVATITQVIHRVTDRILHLGSDEVIRPVTVKLVDFIPPVDRDNSQEVDAQTERFLRAHNLPLSE